MKQPLLSQLSVATLLAASPALAASNPLLAPWKGPIRNAWANWWKRC